MFSKIKNSFEEKMSKLKNFIFEKFKVSKSFLYKKFEKPITFVNSNLTKVINLLRKISIKLHLPQICKKLKLDKFFIFLKRIFNRQLLKKVFLLIIVPIFIYLYCQFLCNGKFIFEKPRMKLNFLLIYFVIGIFYCLIGKVKISLYLTVVVTFATGFVNHFVTSFRGTPLVPWDIFSFNVALTVLPTFKFSFSKNLVFGILLFILAIFTLKKVKIKSYRNNKFKIIYRFIVACITLSFFINFYTTNLIEKFELDENWDPKEEYHNNGLMASLFKQSRNLIITQPDGYDVDSLSQLASSIEVPIAKHNEDFEYPNIIAIMNESFADLSTIGKFSTSEDYLPYFRTLSENTIKGNLHVSIFGAQTPNSEWEFLTSNSMAFVPKRTIPYQQYVLRNSYSLASILKKQGYSTTAMHCYYPQGYNRNIAYPRLGFNSYYHLYTMHNLEYVREYPSDLSTYKNIIKLYEQKSEGEKLFNFTLTMQNHGSYTDENFENTIIAENGQYPKLNQYLSLIKLADNALEYLLNYFSNQEEHTIIILFGDHQPYVEDEFYNSLLSQKYADINSKEATEQKYITPFMIWANYDIDEEKYNSVKDISVNYLASLLLDVANIQKTPYLEFLDNLREEIPIITGNGYVDKNNIYHDFSEETEYSELLNNYHYLQFNNMFDNSSKLTSLFEVPQIGK